MMTFGAGKFADGVARCDKREVVVRRCALHPPLRGVLIAHTIRLEALPPPPAPLSAAKTQSADSQDRAARAFRQKSREPARLSLLRKQNAGSRRHH